MTTKTAVPTQTFVYATYIRTTPEKLWEALISGAFSEQYWMAYRVEFEPRVGGRVRIRPPQGGKEIWDESGKVLAWEPGRKLSYEFSLRDTAEVAAKRDGPSRVTYELSPLGEMVRLRLVHENLITEDTGTDPNSLRGINNGWPAVLSSLKSLLETGKAIPLEACGGHDAQAEHA